MNTRKNSRLFGRICATLFLLAACNSIITLISTAHAASKSEEIPTPESTPAEATPPVETRKLPAGPPSLVAEEAHRPVNDLTWKTTEPAIDTNISTGEAKSTLVGNYGKDDWTLSYEGQKIVPNDKGEFTITVPITTETTELSFTAIGPLGEIQKQTWDLNFPGWTEFHASSGTNIKKRSWGFVPGVGYSLVNYTDSRGPAFLESTLTVKAVGSHSLFNQYWDVRASAFFTAIVLGTNTGLTAQFLGINVTLSYTLPKLKKPWELSIAAGTYYATMFVPNNQFGFSDMAGPELFPVLRRYFNHGDSAAVYMKYAPVSQQFGLLNLSNHEIAFGGNYAYPLKNGHFLLGTLDFSVLSLFLSGVTINVNTYTAGVGYTF